MSAENNCWMDLHQLAASMDECALTRQERFDQLTHELLALPPLVRRELLRELRFILAELTDLEPIVIQSLNSAEEPKRRPSVA
jgi:3-deoxy-D-arabino-heptulosonate 7-phosphate (DAHP) synthase class II